MRFLSNQIVNCERVTLLVHDDTVYWKLIGLIQTYLLQKRWFWQNKTGPRRLKL